MIKVSIILPSLNVGEYIEECVLSAMNQSLWDIEIISVDAGSTDWTLEILNKYAKIDSRIKLLKSEVKSYGLQANVGIEAANGEYIAVLETDDYVDKNMYENLYMTAKDYNLDFILADYDILFHDSEGNSKISTIATWKDQPDVYGKVLRTEDLKKLLNVNPNIWRGIYSKEFLVKKQINFNTTLGAVYQDICFMHRVIMHTDKGMYVPDSYYRYRFNRDGSSVNSANGLMFAYQEYKILFENNEIKKGFEKKSLLLSWHILFMVKLLGFIRRLTIYGKMRIRLFTSGLERK